MFEKAEIEAMKPYIIDYLKERHINCSGHKCFRCLNPLHEDKHPSMCFNPALNNVHCFACGATYDVFDLVGLDANLSSFRAKYEEVQRRYGHTIGNDEGSEKHEQ